MAANQPDNQPDIQPRMTPDMKPRSREVTDGFERAGPGRCCGPSG